MATKSLRTPIIRGVPLFGPAIQRQALLNVRPLITPVLGSFSGHFIQNRSFFFDPRGPNTVYSNKSSRGLINSISNLIPAPLKTFLVAFVGTGIFVLVSVPFLIIATPPLVLAFLWYGSRLRRIHKQLYDQRWQDLGSYGLVFNNASEIFSGPNPIPDKAKSRIYRAIINNEKNLQSSLGLSSESKQLKFTDIERIEEDYRTSPEGHDEKLVVKTYGLLNENLRRIADVNLIAITSSGFRGSTTKMRIEIISNGYHPVHVVLDKIDDNNKSDSTTPDEDIVIDVKEHGKS